MTVLSESIIRVDYPSRLSESIIRVDYPSRDKQIAADLLSAHEPGASGGILKNRSEDRAEII